MATLITVNNDFCQLQTDNQEILNYLIANLKFRQKGYQFTPLYKSKKWDGFVNFFSAKTGKFLTGILPEICMILKKFQETYEFDDHRTPIKFKFDKIDEHFLQYYNEDMNTKIELTDYQVDLVNQAIKHKRGIIVAPTASGKTFLMSALLKALGEHESTLVLQNRKSLAEQNYDEISRWGFKKIGSCWGGNHNPNKITVATAQSIHHMEDQLDKIRVLIVDEVHDMVSDTAKDIYKKLKNAVIRIGLSATPFKHGESDKVHKYMVKGFFGPVIKTNTTSTGRVTTSDLQQKGRLSQSKCIFHKITEPDIQLSIYSEAVDLGIVNNVTLHNKVIEITNTLSGRTLILVDRIAHGDQLKKLIPTAYWITGKDDSESRKEVINMLQSSKTSCIAIATQQIFNTGINVKIHNLINAAGGQADHLIIQRMGRGLRTADDKKEVLYIDFMFENNPYLKKHSAKRAKILEKEGHSLQFLD